MKSLIAILILTSNISFGHILGTDDRVKGNGSFPEIFPYVFIHAGSGTCSGTLIAKNLVLTNLHCVMSVDMPQVYIKYHMLDSYYDLQATNVFISSDVKRVGNSVSYSVIDDWAILKLGDDVGLEVGFCEMSADIPAQFTKVSMAAYHSDFQGAIGIQKSCSILSRYYEKSSDRKRSKLMFDSDCDSTPGSSGSSVVVETAQTCKVIGLHAFQSYPSDANFKAGDWLTLPIVDPKYSSVSMSVMSLLPIVETLKSGQTKGLGFQTLHSELP